jgi:hypothetical protein
MTRPIECTNVDRASIGSAALDDRERLNAIIGDQSGGDGGSATVEDGSSFPETSMPPHPAVVADVVLVDGRFRVAAALKALWHIDDASVVLIHDWTPRKEAYGRVLAYYDVVDKVDTLIVLARKSDVDWNAAAADLRASYPHFQ